MAVALNPDSASRAFAALGAEPRLKVLRTLVRAGPEGLTVGEIGERVGISGSTLTHHLKALGDAGLLTQTRHGRSIVCAAVEHDFICALSEYLLEECCVDRVVSMDADRKAS